MSDTQVTLTVSQVDPNGEASSTTTVNTNSLGELARMLQLAGLSNASVYGEVPAEEPVVTPVDAPIEGPIEVMDVTPVAEDSEELNDYGNNPSSRKGYEYDVARHAGKVRTKVRQVNNYADNPMVEGELSEDLGLDMDQVEKSYFDNKRSMDHDAAVAATADEFGIRGEDVEKAISFERYSGKVALGRSLKEYFEELQSELTAELGEDRWERAEQNRKRRHANYDHVIYMLPVEQNGSLDDLEHNEYFGDGLQSGKSGIVVMRINAGIGDAGVKWRYSYVSTWGDPSYYKPTTKALVIHSQTQKEREAEILFTFTGKEYMDPQGRQQIAQKLQQVGMNPKRKYSLRVFK